MASPRMASKKHGRKKDAAAAPIGSTWSFAASTRAIAVGFAAVVLLFYFQALFGARASIQWDAVDVQYSAQNYLSQMLRAGKLPLWTPYVYSGMPFLADPQVGAWYPLNWPFLLAGITPQAIEWQLALHCLLAAFGGFLLARDLLGSRAAAVFAGLFFAFSGFFAGHSSHPGIFEAASLAPWLLWCGRRAARDWRWLPALAMAAGLTVLTGHFQTALYGFFALAVLLAADAAINRGGVLRGAAVALAVAIVAGVALAAVMVLPGLELTAESLRAGADYSKDAGASLALGALATLVSPDHYGALTPESYSGPQDVTQHYLYMGLLLVPLALAGLASRQRWYGLALTVAGGWYALGPAGGLYSGVSWLPGFRSVRAPAHMWFVAALGLALLAAAGVGVLRTRFSSPWLVLGLAALAGLDLYYWNMSRNRLAYARESFEDLYGSVEERFRTVSAPLMAQPMHRLWAAAASPSYGPLNGSLDSRMEVTFGYNPLELARYHQYMEAGASNGKLLNGLAVTGILNANGMFATNPAALPRIYAPDSVSAVRSTAEAAARLAGLDPAREAVVEGLAAIPHNGGAQVKIVSYSGDNYRARYHAEHETLLCVAVPWFPGWQTEVDGRVIKSAPVDVALTGVLVPAGDHDLTVSYHSPRLPAGLAISAVAWIVTIFGVWYGVRRSRSDSAGLGAAG